MMVDGGIFRMLLNRVVALDWGYAGLAGSVSFWRLGMMALDAIVEAGNRQLRDS